MKRIFICGSFDELQSRQASRWVRFIQEASRLGPVHAVVWPDDTVTRLSGEAPKYPLAERFYFVQALRYVTSVEASEQHANPQPGDIWAVMENEDTPQVHAAAANTGVTLQVIKDSHLTGFPAPTAEQETIANTKHIMVTGTFDWLHTGHVRFFEEVSSHGSLTVVVGHDDNIRLLKGEGHPLFPQAERLYMVQSIRYVQQAMLSTGHGWLDAEPELKRLKPNAYAVNEDGDKPEKHDYCLEHGVEYLVLKRTPKEGLDRRSSTDLRGF